MWTRGSLYYADSSLSNLVSVSVYVCVCVRDKYG